MPLEQIFDDQDFWEEARLTMVRRAAPLFREAFLIGAALGANEKPRPGNVKAFTQDASALGGLIKLAANESSEQALVGLLRIASKQRGDFPGVQGFAPIPGADGLTELPFDLEAITGAADEFIGNYTDDWWRALERSTRDSLRATIQRASAEGLTIEQVIAEVEPLFGAARAERIAVSETTNLLGQGAQETYRRAGFTSWIWRTVRDARVDPICDDLARQSDPQFGGQPFPMTRRFARAHVNCRCWPVPSGEAVVQPALTAFIA